MGTKDVLYRWLSSGGAYYLIALLWFFTAIGFGIHARAIGKAKNSANDGCYLTISTTVFVMIGGAIGMLLFQKFFPWFILTSFAGCVLAPWFVCRTFRSGKRKY